MFKLQDKKYSAGLVGLLVLGGLVWYLVPKRAAEPNIIPGSGFVEGTSIVLSAQVPSTIKEMKVEEGQRVEKGQLIASLDAPELRAKVEQAKAQVEIAVNQVQQAEANLQALASREDQAQLAVTLVERQYTGQLAQAEAALEVARANMEQGKIAMEQAQDDYNRYKNLYDQQAITQAQFQAAEKKLAGSKAQFQAVEKQLEQAKAALQLAQATELSTGLQKQEAASASAYLSQAEAAYKVAQAQEQAARAMLAEAEAMLAKTEIYAPSSGTIVNKLVEQGELVAAGTPLVRLVDMDKLTLTVYVPGKDLGKVKLEMPARVYIDAFPEKPFKGKVTGVAQQAEFTPKNVHLQDERAKLVYAVDISLSNPEGKVKPGMLADTEILLDTRLSMEN